MAKKTKAQNAQISPPSIRVKIVRGNADEEQYSFEDFFKIGRGEECSIIFEDEIVSRVHAEVMLENGQWWFEDLGSTNGSFHNGQRINRVQIISDMEIELGVKGPLLLFNISLPDKAANGDHSVTRYVEHYFDDTSDKAQSGQHTRMIREAFDRVQKKRKLQYYRIIGLVILLAIIIGGYAIYQHMNVRGQRILAENIFYNMKSLELQLAQLQEAISQTEDTKILDQMKQYNASKATMEADYNNFVKELGIYDDMDESERLILKMARIFGECEVNVPDGFVKEVKKYIRNWQSTGRLERAVNRAIEKGYPRIIVDKMLAQHLPPQFFYLALQESDFNHKIVGPQTKYGYAKGIWQFIPQTAIKYKLKTGPLVELKRYDPRDERFDFEKATEAASFYLSDIYKTEAQASGLLVFASYNWGENNIRRLISRMPANPKDRNFWKLLEKYKKKIPKETYQYVFYIFSAAVIGENPALFGFKFQNPLKPLVEELTILDR